MMEGSNDGTAFWDAFEHYEVAGKERALRMAVQDLRAALESGSVESSTRKQFNGAVKRYKEYSQKAPEMVGFRVWPVCVGALVLYLRAIWREKRSLPAMRQALAALKWKHRVWGLPDPTSGGEAIVGLVMKAAARELYIRANRKFGLNPEQVKALITIALTWERARPGEGWGLMAVMILWQYLGTMRFDDVSGLRRHDLVLKDGVEGHAAVRVKGKNQACREGEWRYLAALQDRG